MNLKQALYIKTIAEEGSITAAAKKLYVSQPSLSQMLRFIEEELGVALFDRSHFHLTYAGERYLHAATVMLNANELLANELMQIRQEDSGRLRLGISRQRAASILPAVLPRFSRQYPRVVLELREEGSATLERMLQDGEVDLIFASTNSNIPGFEYTLIQEETIGILAGRDSPLARKTPSGTPITLQAVRNGVFIALKPGHNVRVIQDMLFREVGMRPQVYLETDSMETALQVTLTSNCYMLCPDTYAEPDSFFYPLEGYTNTRHFRACTRRGQNIPKFIRAFTEMVREFLGT